MGVSILLPRSLIDILHREVSDHCIILELVDGHGDVGEGAQKFGNRWTSKEKSHMATKLPWPENYI